MSNLSTTPARDPPAGQTSNLVNPSSIGYLQTIANVLCVFFVLLFVTLRIYTRYRLVKSVSWDDYLIMIAVCIFCVDVGLFQHMVTVGMGKHLWDVSVADFSPRLLQTWTSAAMLYSVSIICIKMSVLMLYRRLFPIGNFRYLWWLCAFCTVGYGLGAIFSSLFACVPVKSNWDINITPTHCINKKAFYLGNGVMNIITDLMILALPIPVVWRLSLELRQKIILSIVFTLGSISCIISVVRLFSIIAWIRVGDDDISYTLQDIVVWSCIELAICIVCANAPCLRPFFEHHLSFLTSFLSSATGGSSQTTSYKATVGRSRKRDRVLSVVFDGGNAMEMGSNHKNNHLVSVTANGGESDSESTRKILRQPSIRELKETEGEDNGIMVQMSYQVQTVKENV